MTHSEQLRRQHGFGTGNRIVVPKSGWNMVQHHALFFGNVNGEAMVAENKEGHGVILTRLDQFLAEAGRITRVEPFLGTYQQQAFIMDRVNARFGRRYDEWNYNCEQFVNDVLHGRVESRQADIGKVILGVVTVAAIGYGIAKLMGRR